MITHFLGDREYDTTLCGVDQLGGGSLVIGEVNCVDCLKTLVAYGLAARDRLTHLVMEREVDASQCETKPHNK